MPVSGVSGSACALGVGDPQRLPPLCDDVVAGLHVSVSTVPRKILLSVTLPLWDFRVRQVWADAGGWQQRYGRRQAVALERSLGKHSLGGYQKLQIGGEAAMVCLYARGYWLTR